MKDVNFLYVRTLQNPFILKYKKRSITKLKSVFQRQNIDTATVE